MKQIQFLVKVDEGKYNEHKKEILSKLKVPDKENVSEAFILSTYMENMANGLRPFSVKRYKK